MNTEEEYGGDLCKNHSARSEKEFCRVCPSKLNKKELENVYFTLLENNLDLKTTINKQREKIKILSTKVQRLTALQKTYLGKDSKDCCGSKALINEQKECISELRRTNQCLSERMRQLNMRLCSAKQFLKRSPFQSTSRCNRCSNKNASMSALIIKRSETNLRTTAASSQYLVKDIVSSRTADNNTISQEKGVQYDLCYNNKCRSQIEELQKRNDDLEGELSRLKETHTTIKSQLELDITELRAENIRVRSDRTLCEDRLEQVRSQLGKVTTRLANADLRCDELTMEVTAEKSKVAELETRLRAADMSSRIASAIETHLTNLKMTKDHTNIFEEAEEDVKAETKDSMRFLAVQSPPYKPKAAVRTKISRILQVEDAFKSPDDSGYTEVNRSQDSDESKVSTHINQVLLEKIADLQNQINSLKAFKNNYDSLKLIQNVNTKNTEILTAFPDTHQIDENIISESSESVVTEKKVNNNITAMQQTQIDKNNSTEAKMRPLNLANTINNGTTEEYQSSPNIDRLKESFENIKTRSNVFSQNNKSLTDSRKLSLQGLRDFFKEKKIVKTGSLDDNRVTFVGSAKADRVEKYVDDDIIMKNSSNSIVDNVSGVNNINNENVNDSNKETQNDIENRDKNISNSNKDENQKDSDSSKGTYTVQKNEEVAKLKTEPNNPYPNLIENKMYKNPFLLAVDVKKLISASRNKLATTSEPRTYVKAPRDVSPDSTECEISSMSDLPSERDERASYSRSPGEERPMTASDSRISTITPTTTDYGSLSEGELPYLRETTNLSDGEKRLCYRRGKSHSVPQMEATLAAVQQELTRCTQLLRSHVHRSLDSPGAT